MAMQRYVKWLGNNRDPEGSGLTDVVNHFEAGQELSRRYTVIDEKADRAEGFSETFRLKGTPMRVEFRTDENPFKGRRNELTPRQVRSKKRLISRSRGGKKVGKR